jgi:hypothetical protein
MKKLCGFAALREKFIASISKTFAPLRENLIQIENNLHLS